MRSNSLKLGLSCALTLVAGLWSSAAVAAPERVGKMNQAVDADQAPDAKPLVEVAVNFGFGVLHVGDPLKVVVDAVGGEDVYLYLIYIDVEDDPILVFPNHVERNNRVAAGARRSLPGRGSRFTIDGPVGNEVLLTIASRTRLTELESLVSKKPAGLPVLEPETLHNELIPKWIAEGADIVDAQLETRSRDTEDLQSAE